jgi:hypothetical protein
MRVLFFLILCSKKARMTVITVRVYEKNVNMEVENM